MPEGKDGRTDGYIELYSGARYVPNSTELAVDIEDIAHALGNQCRYTGHCRHFYSVAEHSILCSLLAEELGICDPFEALMHDGHEALMSDMASPWKPYLPDYKTSEKIVATAFRERFKLPVDTSEGCKKIDYLALFVEAYFLMKSKGENWYDPQGYRVEALKLVKRDGWRVTGLEPTQAKNAFLRRYRELLKDRKGLEWWEYMDMDTSEART